MSHIRKSSPCLIFIILEVIESMPSVFQELDYNIAAAVVFGGRIDTENLLGRRVKPTEAMVFLVASFGRTVVGFFHPGKPKPLCGSLNHSVPSFHPV